MTSTLSSLAALSSYSGVAEYRCIRGVASVNVRGSVKLVPKDQCSRGRAGADSGEYGSSGRDNKPPHYQLGGLGERYNLLRWGSERSHGHFGFGAFWGYKNQVVSTLHSCSAFPSFRSCAKMPFGNLWGSTDPTHSHLYDAPDRDTGFILISLFGCMHH